MECQKCGATIKEGKLYCEICGNEVFFVPDFEPIIEDSIVNALNSIDADNEYVDTNNKIESAHKSKHNDVFNKDLILIKIKQFMRIKNPIIMYILAIVIAIIIIGGIITYQNNSSVYQSSRGDIAYNNNNYLLAASYYSKAYELDDTRMDILFLKARCNYLAGKYDIAMIDLYTLTQEYPEHINESLQMLIDIYIDEGEYSVVATLINEYNIPQLYEEYAKYISNKPEFSLENGSYTTLEKVSLSTDKSGMIYYTIDGTDPTIKSKQYIEPIALQIGNNIIKAISINMDGIVSEVAIAEYYIDIKTPNAPSINVNSGTYKEPMLIALNNYNEDKIYYTTSGGTPTYLSNEYIEPIPMPLGSSQFKFVAINNQGVSSPVITRDYRLDVHTEVDIKDALNTIVEILINLGTLPEDYNNNKLTVGYSKLVYSFVLKQDNDNYFFFTEYKNTENGGMEATENMYAVNVLTGIPYVANKVGINQYFLSLLNNID